ncbi:MAG: hypothetical protein HQ546_04960, partial [Planctomycetes bacterium]|nr:hypothetical protein [Planctomycetota bacterium]
GLYSLQLGDAETAAIAFRRGLEADKMSKEACRDDFTLAYWGLGMAVLETDPDGARVAFERCGLGKTPETVSQENVVFVVSLGRAPWKELWGLYGEQDRFAPSAYEPRSVEILVDGESVGKGLKVIDLFQQSQGVPRSGKDVGQAGKAVGKLLVAALAGAVGGSNAQNLVESAWSVKADTRTCYMLPNEVHVLSTRIAPGRHTVQAKFFNAAGAELPRYGQAWHYVAIPQKGRNYVMLRSEFDRCNVQGPIAFTRVNKVRTNKKSGVTTIRFRASNLPGASVGQTVRVCHFYRLTENRWDMAYHWRYQPLIYNGKGQPMGYPGVRLRMQDYEVGLVGLGEITEIKGEQAIAKLTSLTTGYVPKADDMVTAAKPQGRLWR